MSEYTLLSRLDGIESRFEEVATLITDPNVIADRNRYVKLTKEYSDLEKLVKATRDYKCLINNIEESKQLLAEESDE